MHIETWRSVSLTTTFYQLTKCHTVHWGPLDSHFIFSRFESEYMHFNLNLLSTSALKLTTHCWFSLSHIFLFFSSLRFISAYNSFTPYLPSQYFSVCCLHAFNLLSTQQLLDRILLHVSVSCRHLADSRKCIFFFTNDKVKSMLSLGVGSQRTLLIICHSNSGLCLLTVLHNSPPPSLPPLFSHESSSIELPVWVITTFVHFVCLFVSVWISTASTAPSLFTPFWHPPPFPLHRE